MTRIWAIARQTIAEGVRMKVALVFIGFILLLLVGLPFSLRNEDSVSSAVQTFLSFSLGSLGLMLSLLTIFLSRSLSDELVNKQILVMMTKPIPRWQFIVGKWLGIVTLNLAILAASGAGIYVATRVIAAMPPRDELDKAKLTDEILTARHANSCIPPDFSALARQSFEHRKETGAYADVVDLDRDKEIARLEKDLNAQWRTVGPLDSRAFEFKNVRCERSPDKMLQVRYKAEVYAYPADETLRCEWWVGNPDKRAKLYVVPRRDIVGRFHSISVPTDSVAADHTLTVAFVNRNPFEGEPQYPNILALTSSDDVQVLFNVGTFGGNLFRQLVLMACRLMFLAAVALAAATVFSFPVACLVSLTFLVVATMSGFLGDAITFFDNGGVPGLFRDVVKVLYGVLFFLVPDLSAYDGTSTLVDGRNVPLMWILMAIGRLVLVGTTVVGLLACLLFQRREVSEVSV